MTESPANFLRALSGLMHFAQLLQAFAGPAAEGKWRPPPSVMDQNSAFALNENLSVLIQDCGGLMEETARLFPDVFAGVFRTKVEVANGQDGAVENCAPSQGCCDEPGVGGLS